MSAAVDEGEAGARRRARRWRAVFAAVVVVTAAVKIAAVFAGADPDSDAYGHAMAGRRMLVDPTDIAAHWVWLPLLHALLALATAAGGGLRAVRLSSVLFSSAAPVLLAWLLRDHLHRTRAAGAEASPIPWLAGALLAADPLCLWSGATGQTEPLFALLVLAGCAAWERRLPAAAGALFALSALTRYEAWSLLPVLFLLSIRRPPEGSAGAGRHLVYALPALVIAAWCVIHWRATGEPFQVFRLNREFVKAHFEQVGYLWGPEPDVLRMLVFYVWTVPVWTMLGPVYLLAFAGVPRALRGVPASLLLVGGALLAAATVGFIRGAHLGLPRHAIACSPLFCALVATGATALADRLSAWRPRLSAPRAQTGVAAAVLTIVLASRTAPGALRLMNDTRHAFAGEAAAAAALREAARPGELIFCEDAPLEVLSGLPPAAFVRWQVPDVTQINVIGAAHDHGSVLVVAKPARMGHLSGGETVWSGEGFAIVRFEAPDGGGTR